MNMNVWVSIMRVNVLTLLIKSSISHQTAFNPPITTTTVPSSCSPVSLTHNHTCLCQGGLSGVVKLSIARKRSFIKADRRGGRLLKLITPWSHRECGLLSVSDGPSPSSPPYLHLQREQNRVDVWWQGEWLWCVTWMDNLKTKDLHLADWLFYYISKKRWHQLYPSFQEAI